MSIKEKALRAYGAAREPVSARLRYARMLAVYDSAIEACANSDETRLKDGLQLLEQTLDFSEYPELAMSLAALYSLSRESAGAGDFETAQQILLVLRSAWAERCRRDLETGGN